MLQLRNRFLLWRATATKRLHSGLQHCNESPCLYLPSIYPLLNQHNIPTISVPFCLLLSPGRKNLILHALSTHPLSNQNIPPLTSTTLPFTYRPPSPNKNKTTSTTSTTLPILPNATLPSASRTPSSPRTTHALVGVSIYPGANAFTRIPRGPSSSARHFERPIMANLLEQ